MAIEDDGQTADKPLTPAQTKRITKAIGEDSATAKTAAKLNASIQEAEHEKLRDYVPVPLLVSARAATMEFDALMVLVRECATEGWVGGFKPLDASLKTATAKLNENHARMTAQLAVANSIVNGGA